MIMKFILIILFMLHTSIASNPNIIQKDSLWALRVRACDKRNIRCVCNQNKNICFLLIGLKEYKFCRANKAIDDVTTESYPNFDQIVLMWVLQLNACDITYKRCFCDSTKRACYLLRDNPQYEVCAPTTQQTLKKELNNESILLFISVSFNLLFIPFLFLYIKAYCCAQQNVALKNFSFI